MEFQHEWLASLVDIAAEAGSAIMKIYGQDIEIREKSDCSPVTEADLAANRIIESRLKALAPEVPILSEEYVDVPERARFGAGMYWLVDPLDGTKEFLKRNGEFTVNIALIDEGVPVLGVVYAPALELIYIASKGAGAFKREGDAGWVKIHCNERPEDAPWKVVGSRSHAGESLKELLNHLGKYEMAPMGSSLKICLVAEGRAHLYPRLGQTSLWDTAAAQCVVQESGGKVVTLEGNTLSYSDTTNLLNPFFIVYGLSKPDLLRLKVAAAGETSKEMGCEAAYKH